MAEITRDRNTDGATGTAIPEPVAALALNPA
jgi:hypothetical protein